MLVELVHLARLEARGVRWTWVTETVTMVSSAAVLEPVLISVKAVDPKVYPFYGTVKLNPPTALADSLQPRLSHRRLSASAHALTTKAAKAIVAPATRR